MNVLEVQQLCKRYRNGTLANDGISLALAPGEIYGLLGPNGAGKTTLVRQVLGLLRPTSGSIMVDGVDVVADPGYARQNIGFLPQVQFEMSSLRVDELISLVTRLRGISRADARRRTDAIIERLQLEPFRKTPLLAASGGVRRLALFAAAAAADSRLLVLDEPTNDVDPVRRQLLWSVIDELGARGSTVLLVTHNLAEAERVIDRFAIIDQGRILHEGTPASMRSLVTDRLRLEVTLDLSAGAIEPHASLVADPRAEGTYLFEQRDLPRVSAWLSLLRERRQLLDFRIGPPDLDAIYVAAVSGQDGNHGNAAGQKELVRA